LLAVIPALTAPQAVAPAPPPCRQEVRFQRGAVFATYTGHLAGYGYCDYVFTASAGQRLQVSLRGRRSNRLEARLVDAGQEALLSGDSPVSLSQTGEHTVRVLMPRAFARRGYAVSYQVTITIR
jgi:hypothetical protein